jgi:osmotically-inducible protein OsmY
MIAPYRWRIGWLAVAALAASGCGSDAEILARVGRKVMSKLEAAGRETAGQLTPRWEMDRAAETEPALDARVAHRLAWDQALAGTAIEVRLVDEKTVELTGQAMNMNQRQRAADLAQTTTGVEKVIDSLTLPEAKP